MTFEGSDSAIAGEELEGSIVASAIDDEDNAKWILTQLTDLDFVSLRAREMFRALKKAWQEHQSCAVFVVRRMAIDSGLGDEFSWIWGLKTVFGVLGPTELQTSARLLRDNTTRHRLLRALDHGRGLVADPERSVEAIQAEIARVLSEVSVSRRQPAQHWSEGLGELSEALRRQAEDDALARSQSIDLGVPGLSEMLGGAGESELIILGARPGVGKTAMGIQIARHVALTCGPVLFFSLELSRAKFWRRVACQQLGVRLDDLTEENVARCRDLNAQLWIEDQRMRPEELLRRVELFRLEHPDLCMVVLDHLGILAGSGAETKQMSLASNCCREAMRATGLPFIVLAQIRRAAEFKAEAKPTLSDLKGSGCIEEDARKVVLLHRPPLQQKPGTIDPQNAVAIVAKNGEGRLGEVPLRYHGELFTFFPGRGSGELREPEYLRERVPGRDFPAEEINMADWEF